MTSDEGGKRDSDGARDRRTGRFKQGHCPNVTGRRGKAGKAAATVASTVKGALNEAVPVMLNGRRRKMSKLKVAATKVVNQGLGGNLRAAKMAFDYAEKAELQAAAQPPNDRLSESDEEIVERLKARFRRIIKEEEDGPPDPSRV